MPISTSAMQLTEATLARFKDGENNEFFVEGVGYYDPADRPAAEFNAVTTAIALECDVIGWDTFKMEKGEIMVGHTLRTQITAPGLPPMTSIWLVAGPMYDCNKYGGH